MDPPATADGSVEWQQRLSQRMGRSDRHAAEGGEGSQQALPGSKARRHTHDDSSDEEDVGLREAVVRCLHNPCYVAQGVLFTTVLSFIVFTMGVLFKWW